MKVILITTKKAFLRIKTSKDHKFRETQKGLEAMRSKLACIGQNGRDNHLGTDSVDRK